ncbi:dual OB domain-containing protein [Nostoc sp. UHCC 0870]|uniref:dual OB domain-containing protein n=1 Tax=Nostoc sp. UHCC 0870 TaxID=2914041 RepID=UPI003FA56592
MKLIKAEKLEWQVKGDQSEKKCRPIFCLGDNFYNLPITDPIWKDKLSCLDAGIYTCLEVIQKLNLENFAHDQFRLTISISEPFSYDGYHQEFCYKLVAAVINVAEVKQRLGWQAISKETENRKTMYVS